MESMNFNVTQTIMDPQERIKRFGIECTGPVGDGILFKAGTWRPGGEYIQKLVVRNVSTQVKKLKYKLPATRYFFLGYPEVITLSPGMFRVIDVVFRPVEHEPYDDTIYFRLQDGIEGNGFHVPVRATIDKLVLHAPDGLDLGYCTTNQTTELVFRLENIGEIDAPYRWEVPYPFMFTPSEGIIGMGSHQDIVISIIPEEASVYVSQATCYVGEGVHAIIPEPTITIKISAIGKYAYIVLSDDLVSFEEVVSGVKPETKEIILKNDSVVPAEFDLIRLDNDRDEVFLINPKSGVIPPLSEVNVTIDYLPLAMGCFSYDRYVFRTPGNCETMLSVKGTTMPPKVLLFKDSALAKYSKDNDHSFTLNRSTSLDASLLENEGAPDFSLNFRDVEIGKVETRILLLKNETNRDAAFSIIADEHGMFQMHPRQGVIPAMYKAFAVTVKFAPTKPINYYRRFFVLIGDALPLFYDCLGTGYIRAKGEIKEQRPAPIRHAHIQAYRNRSMRGLGVLSPDELDEMYANGENRIFFAEVGRMGTRSLSVATIARPVTRTGEAVRPLVAPAHEFFVSSRDKSAREIVISKTELDFDYSPIMQLSNAQTVIITNTTHSKVVVEWQIPIAKGMSLDNNKHSSKDPKDRAMINDGSEERKLKLIQAFEVHPLTAEIDPEKSYTFEVFFHPKQSSRNFVSELEAYVYFKNQRTFRLVNDHSLTPPWCLSLNCIGHTFNSGQLLAKAKITGTNVSGGKLVFPCCFVGESIYQTFTLRNTSDLPSTFRIETGWDSFGATASSADDSFTVKPTSGEVDADDFTLICVKFTPKSVKKSLQLLRCIINGSEGGKLLLEGSSAVPYVILPDLNPNKYTPIEHVLGLKKVMPTNIPTGTQGTFFMKPTCVGLSSRRNLSLKNATRLPLRYVVAVVEGDEHILNLTPKKGILKGNELADIDISFVPKASVMYNFKINVMIYPLGGKGIRVIDANQPGPVKAPELLQTLTVDVVCPGEVGAIIFDPPHLTVDVRLVNSSESKDIYIENVSDSDVKYQLFYKEEFVADLAGGATGKRVVSNVMPLTPAHAYTVESLIDDNHSIAESKKLYEHCLNCELPSGILGARSRQRVIFTYHPRKAGLFEFLIFAKIQAIDEETGKPKMISNDEAALLRLSQQDREDQAFHDLDQLTEELARLPLTTSISARAAYPKLLIEDIRTIGDLLISNIDNLWKRMALSYINYDLSVPMTPEEIKLNNMPSPDLEKIPKYKFEFAAGVINTPTQTIVLQLRNNGYLTTSYSMSLPNEKTLELETWCDEEEPSAEHNRLVSIIEELKVFSIEPKQATLDPGESCQLTITYNHSSLKYDGVHNLPVLVKLTQGKQFYIDLIGYTLPSPSSVGRRKGSAVAFNTSQSGNIQPMPTNQSALQNSVVSAPGTAIPSNLPDIYLVICTDKDNCYWLKPVPIGLNVALAPRQRIELINLCGHDINYEIEFDSIHKLIDQNFQMPIVTIANPVGTVPAHNSIFLECYVYSLQATVYELPLVIKYSSATPVYLDRLSSGMNNPRSSAASKRGPRNSSANSLSSGRSSRSQNLQAQIPAPPVFRYLNAIVKFEGYDPRGTKPLPYGATFAGGLAPTRPILKLPTQQVTLVEDLLDFNVVPQLCSTRRLLILQNHSPSSAYEFVVNISTCVLYQENILEIRPPYGKIEASSSFVIDVILKANAQPFIFNELVKIMVREIVRNAPSRKGGMRQSLLDKIKKKSSHTLHESIVSRPTFSRSQHIDGVDSIHEGKSGNLPTTVNAAGEVITPTLSNAALKLATMQQNAVNGFHADDYTLNDNATASLAGGTVHASLEGGSVANASTKYSANDLATVHETRSRASSSRHRPTSKTSQNGDMSRSGMISRDNSDTNSRFSRNSMRSAQSEANTARLGVPFTFFVRVVGEIHTIETVKKLLERTEEKRIDGVMDNFVIPEQHVFIRPVGEKFDNWEMMGSPSKARVNLAFVKNRDAELRDVAEMVASKLLRDLLGSTAVTECLTNTLMNFNPQSIGLVDNHAPVLKEAKLIDKSDALVGSNSNFMYGVYYNEVIPAKALTTQVICLLKNWGFESVEPRSDCLHANHPFHTMTPVKWISSEESVALIDQATFSLKLSDLRMFLATMKVTLTSSPVAYKDINAILKNFARPLSENVEPSRIDEYTLETDYDATNYLVTICDLIDGLPNQLRSFVSTKVGLLVNQQKKKEIASRKTVATTEKVIKADVNLEATSIDNVEFNQNRAHTPKANQFEQEDQQSADSKPDSDPDAPTQTSIAFQETGFLDLAKDVLSATFFELLQDSKYLMSSENPEEETEEDYENPEGMTAVYDAVRAVSLDIN